MTVHTVLSILSTRMSAHLLQVEHFVLHFLQRSKQFGLSKSRLLQLSLQVAHKLLRVLKPTSLVLDVQHEAHVVVCIVCCLLSTDTFGPVCALLVYIAGVDENRQTDTESLHVKRNDLETTFFFCSLWMTITFAATCCYSCSPQTEASLPVTLSGL